MGFRWTLLGGYLDILQFRPFLDILRFLALREVLGVLPITLDPCIEEDELWAELIEFHTHRPFNIHRKTHPPTEPISVEKPQ